MLISYKTAQKSDADLLIKIYNDAFYDDFVYYGECPAYGKTKEQMEISIEKYPRKIIYTDNVPCGAVSCREVGFENYFVECLCVIPAFQRKGIGTKAFFSLLPDHPNWKSFELITSSDKK